LGEAGWKGEGLRVKQNFFKRQSVTAKLPTWKSPTIPLSEGEASAYRQLIVEAVFSIYNTEKCPCDLARIYSIVKEKVKERISQKAWPYAPFCRSKRTVDRRVNEAASPDFNGGLPKIVAVTSGIYQVNPSLFKVEILAEATV
jgi:hypothetical protein